MHHTTTTALALACMLTGCLEDQSFVKNVIPEANAGEDQQVDYHGEPVKVTLDGSASSDRDGHVVTYRWRSADSGPDGGAPSQDLDPEDVERPALTLDRGNYAFTLWVVDDHGATSAPDSVTVHVGTDVVAECTAEVDERVDDSCRSCLCAMSDECRAAALGCSEVCWDLILCIGDSGCEDGDVPCIVAACPDSAVAGGGQAMKVGPCLMECGDACSSGGADAGS